MRGIRSGVNPVFMWVYILKVMFCRLRQIHKSLLHLQSHAKPAFFCKVHMLFASETYKVMAGACESYRSLKMYNSLKETDDETPITELVRRGYNIDIPRKKTTAEIVKIG